MTDRPARWPEAPDITVRLRAKRGEWTCIREEAASEIEDLRAKLAIAVEALEAIPPCAITFDPHRIAKEALTKIKETK